MLNRILKKAEPPLEVVILLVSGISSIAFGVFHFPVSMGVIHYYKNGLYGLFLVMFALQIIALGKSPFGDFRRSKSLLAVGLLIAAAGIVTCFIPDILNDIQRFLLTICFGAGGGVLFFQMLFHKNKYLSWKRYGGIFSHLIFGCAAVYCLSILIGFLIWKDKLLGVPLSSIVVVLFGAAVVYLAIVLWKIFRIYPESIMSIQGNLELSTDQSIILLMGLFMILLGLLLIPVNLGMLPFSGSAQLGLLILLFAIQMLASGNTPIGSFQRTWLIISFGVLFAIFGIVSCMIPNIMVPFLTILVGVLNMAGGFVSLIRQYISYNNRVEMSRSIGLSILKKVSSTQFAMNLLSIMFGASVFFSNLIPGILVGFILAVNGVVLLYLLHLLMQIEKIKKQILTAP